MDKVKMIYKVEILKCPSELFAKGIELRAEGISTHSTFSTFFNSTFYILHFTFYEGLTPPSLSLCRPLGLLENGNMKRKKKSGLTFYEGLTPPSLLLCHPPGFDEISTL